MVEQGKRTGYTTYILIKYEDEYQTWRGYGSSLLGGPTTYLCTLKYKSYDYFDGVFNPDKIIDPEPPILLKDCSFLIPKGDFTSKEVTEFKVKYDLKLSIDDHNKEALERLKTFKESFKQFYNGPEFRD
jgi:hypothetical protein